MMDKNEVEVMAKAIYEDWANVETGSSPIWETYTNKFPKGAEDFRRKATKALKSLREYERQRYIDVNQIIPE